MGAREIGEALVSFQDALALLLCGDLPELDAADLQIPVCIQHGSVLAFIPDSVELWLAAFAGTVLTAYAVSAATKMAQNDFEGVGLRRIFRESLSKLQTIIRIANHMKTTDQSEFQSPRWKVKADEVGIQNSDGHYIYVPRSAVEAYVSFDAKAVAGMVRPVRSERTLALGVVEEGRTTEVRITLSEKGIYLPESGEEDEMILAELRHGQQVSLLGELTRGNRTTNSVGLRYKGHILDCHPTSGSVVKYRDYLFRRCHVEGSVDRLLPNGSVGAKKPKLWISSVQAEAATEDEPTLL